MIVCIAGKMNGLPDKGRQVFEEAETKLKAMGFTVLNPTCLLDGSPGDRYMPTCLTMVDTADILVLLPDWIYSPGAALEKAFAEYQGKMVFELCGLEKCMDEWQKLLAATWKITHGDFPCQTFPVFIRNHCTVIETPMVNIGYVEQLKKQIKNQAAIIKQLEAKVDTLSAKAALFDDAMATGARMERERDALLKDIGSAQGCICIICKNYNNPNPGTGTAECNILGRFKDCGSDGALTCGQFKWRGVKEE